MSDMLDMLRDVPPRLAAAWGGWLVSGLLLLFWHLRASERERDEAHALAAQARAVRSTPGARPRPPKPATADAFGELEALLDPEVTGAVSRRPGD